MTEKKHGTGTGLIGTVQKVWGPGPLQQARMRGPSPDRIAFKPRFLGAKDTEVARALLSGRIRVAGLAQPVDPAGEAFWSIVPVRNEMFVRLHAFSWLPALLAPGSVQDSDPESDLPDTAQREALARALFDRWIDHYERWAPDVWAPLVTAERLTQILCHQAVLLGQRELTERSRILNSLARQTRFLAQNAHKATAGTDQLMTAIGLSMAALCIPGCVGALENGQELVRREMRLQMRSDGGHISRNPSTQLELALRLHMLRETYSGLGRNVPGFVRLGAERMGAMVRFFRLGDGRLAVFNGGYEDDPRCVEEVLNNIDADSPVTSVARYSHYQRVEAARTTLIADVGDRREPFSRRAFDGASAFEFSVGRSRLVVNCGNGEAEGSSWSDALRQAAAHSTLSIEGGAVPERSVFSAKTEHTRTEDIAGSLIEIFRPFSARMLGADSEPDTVVARAHAAGDPGHFRALYVAAGGDDIRGEDRITHLPTILQPHWRLRFHLHPGLKASLARDNRSVLIVLRSGEGWRFRTDWPVLSLEPSVYFGGGSGPVQTQQIVLASAPAAEIVQPEPADPTMAVNTVLDTKNSYDIMIRWAFRRLDHARG